MAVYRAERRSDGPLLLQSIRRESRIHALRFTSSRISYRSHKSDVWRSVGITYRTEFECSHSRMFGLTATAFLKRSWQYFQT